MLKFISVVLLVLVVKYEALQCTGDCQKQPTPLDCKGGSIVKLPCGFCQECAKTEGETCGCIGCKKTANFIIDENTPHSTLVFGRCEKGLKCQIKRGIKGKCVKLQ
eukprot:TCONS_00054801-protein